MQFKDVQFLSAAEKEKVFRAWKRFLDSGLKEGSFTDALYKHLSLHCSFIAHYNRNGFWGTYFADPEDSFKFFQQFDKDKEYKSWEYGWNFLDSEEYNDINKAMCNEFETRKKSMYARFKAEAKDNKLTEIKRLQTEVTELGTTEQQKNISEVVNMPTNDEGVNEAIGEDDEDDCCDEDEDYNEVEENYDGEIAQPKNPLSNEERIAREKEKELKEKEEKAQTRLGAWG
jgi:hypothetical protein